MAIKKKAQKKKTSGVKRKNTPEITGDILMGDLISRYPQVSGLLMERGFHCIGCAVSPYESLESGAAVHGIDLKSLLEDVNALLRNS
jgi:hybrid cluster-associated redox disulfide protein